MTNPPRYRPEDPRTGDLVYIINNTNNKIDLSKPEDITKNAAIILKRISPEHHNGAFDYKILVQLVDGKQLYTLSQGCKCLRELQRNAQDFSKALNDPIRKLERMIPKKVNPPKESGPTME